MTRGILISPDKTIIERDFAGLADLQAAVQGPIEAIYLSDGSTLWCNEEYGYRFGDPCDVNWIASDVASLGGCPQYLVSPLLGPVVLQGPGSPSGGDTDVTDKGRRWVMRVANEAGGKWVQPVAP